MLCGDWMSLSHDSCVSCRCGAAHTSAVHPREKKKKDKHRYQYGNHSRYYGYQGFYGDKWEGRVGAEEDPRLRLLEADWFRDKTVLDVGCGTGHVTLAVARRFNPTHILGVELDKQLVHAAKQNIRHFLSHELVVEERGKMGEMAAPPPPEQEEKEEEQAKVMEEFQKALSLLSFPLSFRVSRGPLAAAPLLLPPSSSSSRFPSNITFIQVSSVLHQKLHWHPPSAHRCDSSHRATMSQSRKLGLDGASMMSSCVSV